jgi:hypothetical protein
MNRRSFLKFFAIGAGLLGSGACISESLTESIDGLAYPSLPLNIQTLYAQGFSKALPTLSLEDLVLKLREKGVYKQGEFNASQIQANASEDLILTFNNSYYTQSELLLYAVVARLYDNNKSLDIAQTNAPTVVDLLGVDLLGGGGGLKNFKAITGGADECRSACEEELSCNAYTYAKESHPIPSKQGHCWLKKEGFTYNKNENYISGIKI